MTGPNSLSFELFVLVVVRVLRIRADLAPVGVLTLLDAVLLHHQLALLIRHLLAVREDEDEGMLISEIDEEAPTRSGR